MKRRLLLAVACTALACGCAPALSRYKHVVVAESAKVKVLEWSTESNDSQGRPLSSKKIGLPTKSVLTTSGYVVTVLTPVNPTAVVFLKAEDENQKALVLRGAHMRQIEENSGMGLEGYRYSFIVGEATENSIDFDVVTEQGAVLGHEKVRYEVVSRGYVWVVDSV